MEESKKIQLSLGDTSMNKELGIYYIDMRPAIIHYEPNIWGGKFDEKGVPQIKTNDGYQYFPINIAQFGFILHAEWLTSKDKQIFQRMINCLEVLEALKTENENECVWWHQSPNFKYKLKPPWASAMAQGELISFYLRMYQINEDKKLLDTAIKSYNFLKNDTQDKGVRRHDSEGNLWFEEYPSSPPSYVLNGFIYTLFGLFDLYRVTNNEAVKKDIDECIKTLKLNLSKFSTCYWSLYDLQKKELVRYYYQKNVHIPQMEILYLLTGENIFLTYKNKWKAQLTWFNFIFVQIMYRLRPRLLRFRII